MSALAIPAITKAPGQLIQSADWTDNFTTIQTYINGSNLTAANLASNTIGAAGNSDLNSNIAGTSLSLANNQISVAPRGISATQIADYTITATQIAPSTITGAQIQNNVTLGGKGASLGGNWFVTSGGGNPSTNNLGIIRGRVSASGTVAAGEGFSVSASGGLYTITWSVAFYDQPAVTASVIGNGLYNRASVYVASTTGVQVSIEDGGFDFYFIAIGQVA